MMTDKIFSWISGALLVLMFSSQLHAVEESALSAELEKRIGTIMGLLQDKAMPKEQRDVKMIDAVEDLFDFNLMARLSLGKAVWSPLSNAQKEAFTDIFVTRLKRSYLEKMYLYTDEDVEVLPIVKNTPSRISVPAYIVDGKGKTELIYKFYKSKKSGWLLYDLEVEGVSFIQTYRTQFAGILKESTFDEMVERLKTSEPL